MRKAKTHSKQIAHSNVSSLQSALKKVIYKGTFRSVSSRRTTLPSLRCCCRQRWRPLPWWPWRQRLVAALMAPTRIHSNRRPLPHLQAFTDNSNRRPLPHLHRGTRSRTRTRLIGLAPDLVCISAGLFKRLVQLLNPFFRADCKLLTFEWAICLDWVFALRNCLIYTFKLI